MDTIVHLAADPSTSATWESLMPNNVVGTAHLFQAAIDAKCRRVVFASSINAVNGYPWDRQIQPDDPVSPGNLYGVSKCFGEALARYAAVQKEISSIVLRIGAFLPPPYLECEEMAMNSKSKRLAYFSISKGDLVQILHRSIEDERLGFAIIHALSGKSINKMDTTTTRELLGCESEDDYVQCEGLFL